MDLKGKSKLKLLAPAKVNLRLKITGRRPDGYHLLQMVMVKLDLADEIELKVTGDAIRIETDLSDLPAGPSNTVYQAVDLVRRESGKRFGVQVRLRKKIPVAAGLGGGSSDAAAVLQGLNSLLEIGWKRSRLIDLGVRIGADVPFFLAEGSQKVSGIGEILEPVDLPPLSFVLVHPGFPVSTEEVYQWYDQGRYSPEEGDPPPPADHSRTMTILTEAPQDAIPPLLENDLEEVVIPRYPVLDEIKQRLIRAGALGSLMSGSGATVFGVFETDQTRDRGYEILLKAKDPDWWTWKGNSIGGR